MNALTHFPLLWEKYKENFIASKYQITSQGNPIAFNFINKRLSSSVESSPEGMKQQLARLHFVTIVSPLDLGRLSLTILEPLQVYLEDSEYSETNIGHSVVFTLFEMLSNSIDDTMEMEEKVEKLATWQSLGLKLVSVHCQFIVITLTYNFTYHLLSTCTIHGILYMLVILYYTTA